RHTRSKRDWSSDVCSSDLSDAPPVTEFVPAGGVPPAGYLSRSRTAPLTKSVFPSSEHPFTLTPDVVDMNMIALAMRQHQVGAFALANHPAILEIKRLRWIFSHQLHRLRQRKAVALV